MRENIPIEKSAASEKPTRRTLLKALGGLAGLGGIEAGRRVIKSELPKTEQIDSKFSNVVHVETPEARYNVVYSRHTIPNNPDIARQADAVLLEYLSLPDAEEKVKSSVELMLDKDQYS